MRSAGNTLSIIGLSLLLVACGSAPPRPSATTRPVPPRTADTDSTPRRGAYYQDDGPGDNAPANLDQIADAVPRAEPYARAANRPYVVFGQEYRPDLSDRPFRQRGVGSWYGRKFHGQRTSSGEIYDMYAMTAAHPTLPIPSYVRVTHLGNGRAVVVRINDRGPFLHDRVIDLSFAAAYRLGYSGPGSANVEVERLLPQDIAAGRYALPAPLLAATPVEERPVAVATPVTLAEAPTASPLPPVASTPGSVPPLAAPGGFVLQLGAFRYQVGAEDFRSKLSGQLAGLADRLHVQQGGDFFRVLLGPYRDRGEAEQVAGQVRGLLDLRPLVVPRRQPSP